MTSFFASMFILLMAYLAYLFVGGKEEKVSVLYGYPRDRSTWLTVYYLRKSREWVFEWDDLFADPKPASWGSSSCIYEDKESGATKAEMEKAWNLIKQEGLL